MNNENETQTGTQSSSQGTPSQQTPSSNPFQPEGEANYEFTKQVGAASAKPAAPAAPVAAPAFGKKEIQELVNGVAAAVRPQEKPAAMTMDEFNRVMQVLNITPKHAADLGFANPEQAAPVLHDLFQALARQAVTMSNYQISLAKKELVDQIRTLQDQHINPLNSFVQEQREATYRKAFLTKHPDMEGFEPLLETVYGQMKAEGIKFDSVDEAFSEVHKRATALIATLSGVSKENKAATTTTPAPQQRRMSTVSAGGQGGAGTGTKATGKTQAFEIFGSS